MVPAKAQRQSWSLRLLRSRKKLQTPSSNQPTRILIFGAWCLSGAWFLDLGSFNNISGLLFSLLPPRIFRKCPLAQISLGADF
jgi:hypothetical protein